MTAGFAPGGDRHSSAQTQLLLLSPWARHAAGCPEQHNACFSGHREPGVNRSAEIGRSQRQAELNCYKLKMEAIESSINTFPYGMGKYLDCLCLRGAQKVEVLASWAGEKPECHVWSPLSVTNPMLVPWPIHCPRSVPRSGWGRWVGVWRAGPAS